MPEGPSHVYLLVFQNVQKHEKQQLVHVLIGQLARGYRDHLPVVNLIGLEDIH